MLFPNGSESVLSAGPLAQLIGVKHCPCEDGKSRRVFSVGCPDTYWTAPGKVTVRKRGRKYTVTGFITYNEGAGYRFIANQFGKNADVIQPPQSNDFPA